MSTRPLSFFALLKAAFSARPAGMFVAPNWIGLAAAGILGFLNPGIWIIGAAAEFAYLLACTGSSRFRQWAAASAGSNGGAAAVGVPQVLESLGSADRQRYVRLVNQCQEILRISGTRSEELNPREHARGLGHLAWIYLNLLQAETVITRHLQSAREAEAADGSLEEKLEEVNAELKKPGLPDDLLRSHESLRSILLERLEKRGESLKKLEFTRAEQRRIEEQVQLMRDDAALQADPQSLSGSIDRVTGELQDAAKWIAEQRQFYRGLDGLLDEPPDGVLLEAQQ
ncbi:MAG: hypothetical protein KA004_09725 [Verrucomicrobiales bacterium]|nr:hypothetical protein [Verrucomicrobiales bacterium]